MSRLIFEARRLVMTTQQMCRARTNAVSLRAVAQCVDKA